MIGVVLATPLAAGAQQKAMPVVGVLDAKEASPDLLTLLTEIRKGLAEAGYREGEKVAVQYRNADGHYDRLPALAADLVRDKPAVIVAPQLPSVLAAKTATATIPIVFMLSDDPVKHGLVEGLSRPGGNATGLSMLAAGLTAKRLQLLRELVPNATHVGLLVNPGNANIELRSTTCRPLPAPCR